LRDIHKIINVVKLNNPRTWLVIPWTRGVSNEYNVDMYNIIRYI